jgi:phospholipid/cholesterol/gamma-HCH transport system permease protein
MSVGNPCSPEWHLDRDGPVATLRLSGDWLARETGMRHMADARRVLRLASVTAVRVDASGLGKWDSALIAFLKSLRDGSGWERGQAVQVDDAGLPEAARRLLRLATADAAERTEEVGLDPSLATRLGNAYLAAISGAVDVAALVGETTLRGAAVVARKTHSRAVDVFQLVCDAGAGALGIVAIVNGLIGAILAFVGAMQLQRFGAGIYVANLVGVAMVREMAAIGTAIVVAGRTGGAYAAHLATMQGNEEVDALGVLGIRVFDFLVLPRVVALVAMMPLLYLYGCAVGLFGGFLVSMATLDLTAPRFLEQLRGAVGLSQFGIGLTKSVVFGALVALAGCHIGLSAGRSAAEVGRAATTAVVAGIIGVIALDAIFAVCLNALGI